MASTGGGAALAAIHLTDPSGAAAPSCTPQSPTLIISTHRTLYELGAHEPSQCIRVVSTGLGKYYGVVPLVDAAPWLLIGSQSRLASSLRSNSTGLPRTKDALLLVHPRLGSATAAWILQTEYLHDMTRADDGLIYAVDSANGIVSEYGIQVTSAAAAPAHARSAAPGWLALPHPASSFARVSLRRLIPTVPLLSGPPGEAHANNVLATRGQLWVMHHNRLRRSAIHVLERSSGKRLRVLPLAGSECHNPLFHKGAVLYLLSAVGGLARLSSNGSSTTLWTAGPGWFAKGLAVVDDIAYFGVSPKAHRGDERTNVPSKLVAYGLDANKVLSRTPLPHPGLINAISAPRIAPSCSWRACDTRTPGGAHGAAREQEGATSRHEPDPVDWRLVGSGSGPTAAGNSTGSTMGSAWQWPWGRRD